MVNYEYDPVALSKMSKEEQMAYMAKLPMDDHQDAILYTGIVLTSIMVVFVSLRIYTRAVIMKVVGSDDYMIIIAAITGIILGVFHCIGVKLGSGLHMWVFNRENLVQWGKNMWITTIFYISTVAFMKISVLLQVLRITARQTTTRIAIIILLVISTSFSLVSLCLHVFQCSPINYAWDRYDSVLSRTMKATCINSHVMSYFPAISNVVMDLFIWIAPMPVIWKLQLPKVQRFSLVAVFSVAGIVCVAAIARLVELVKLLNNETTKYDQSYLQTSSFIWAVVEANLAIILASIPPLRPLFKNFMPSVFGSLHPPSKGVYNSKDYYRQNGGTNGSSQMRSGTHDGYGVKNHVRVRGMEDHDEIQEEWDRRSAASSDGKGSVERLRGTVPMVVKPERGIIVRSQVEVAVEQAGRNHGRMGEVNGSMEMNNLGGRGGNVISVGNGQHNVGIAMGGGRTQGWER